MESTPSRRFFDRFEPVHGITYFAPECWQAMAEASFRGSWTGRFATRRSRPCAAPAWPPRRT
jgi:hypothetical protein